MKKIFIGVDIGSISAKLVALDESGKPFHYAYKRTFGRPAQVAEELLKDPILKDCEIVSSTVVGSGAKLLASEDFDEQNEFKAITKAINVLYPNVKTIFEMGGESSKFIKLNGASVVEYGVNGDCAAGTGSFIDQQAMRLHYNIEDVGKMVCSASKGARVAGRCSVFAKSDMIHAQQKGYTPPEVLKGLCLAVARNFKATIVKGRHILPDVAFIGGLAQNEGVVASMKEVFDLSELFIPKEAAYIGAYGAALLAKESNGIKKSKKFSYKGLPDKSLEPLSTEKVLFLRDRAKKYNFPETGKVDSYLGIDIGSVSTNFVLIDRNGSVMMEIYTYTKARPIEVVTEGLKEIKNSIGSKIDIKGVGTTGSGRELIGELIGADVIKDEITAHKTGAAHICSMLVKSDSSEEKNVDTIFEIGGQDAKFIRIDNGVVVDFAMNEACAAGTGSFLEEQAEKLGIKIKEEFAKLALSSKAPISLGERCTVFMERDVNSYQLKGSRVEDIVAGLAYSVATNYLNRVVRGRKIGEHIFFQGGTAYNDAVAAAFSQILGKTITVPPHNGVIGAIGSALLARDFGKGITKFRGYDLGKINYTMREFACNACSNNCDIQEFNVEGEKTYWGDKCSTRFRKKAHTTNKPVVENLFELRSKLIESYLKTGNSKKSKRIGIPRTMFYYDRIPFWAGYFNSLGFEIVLSDETNKKIVHESSELSVAEPCFPIKLVHGHVKNLVEKGVDYIFVPNVINSEPSGTRKDIHFYLCPWHQTLPFIINSVPEFEKVDFLVPTVQFEYGKDFTIRSLEKVASKLGFSRKENRIAAELGFSNQEDFRNKTSSAGKKALSDLSKNNAEGIILVGRPYNVYDAGANLNIAAKLKDHYGTNVIPFDMLPLDEIDIEDVSPNMFWNYGRKIIAASKFVSKNKNLHMIYITNFKCGPDSFVKHFSFWAANKPYLTLQFDEHANDAGTVTRVEAYLDSKGLLKTGSGAGKLDSKQILKKKPNIPNCKQKDESAVEGIEL